MTDEEVFRAEVRAVLAERLRPRPAHRPVQVMGAGTDDLEAGRSHLAILADGGWAVPTWPVVAGGRGVAPAMAPVLAQELGRFDVPDLYPFMVGIALVGPTVLTHGTAEQQARWLPRIRSGEDIWCQLFSEPDAGSDLAGLTCRAERDGGSWRVWGQKTWSSRAHYARWGLLLARTDPSVPKHAGITCFAIDLQRPGVEVRPLRQMNGDRHFNEVFLDGAVVDEDDRIGGIGDGWRVALTTLMHERSSIGGEGRNAGGATGDRLIALARQTGTNEDLVRRQRLAAAASVSAVARYTALRAREAARCGLAPGPEGSGAKLRMSRSNKDAAALAAELLGPDAIAWEEPAVDADEQDGWRTLLLTAPSLSIRGGTDEVQRNIVGERVLGLPREPRTDKDGPFRAPPT